MNLVQAQSILDDYPKLFTDEIISSGAIRLVSELPYTKEAIIQAFKLYFVEVVKDKNISQEEFDRTLMATASLDLFMDEKYMDIIEKHNKLTKEQKADLFLVEPNFAREIFKMEKDSMNKSYWEVSGFIDELQKLDTTDSLYLQKAYSLANIPYEKSYKASFDNPEKFYGDNLLQNRKVIYYPKKIVKPHTEKAVIPQKEKRKINWTKVKDAWDWIWVLGVLGYVIYLVVTVYY